MKLYTLSLFAIIALLVSCTNAKELEPDADKPEDTNVLKGVLVTDMSTYGSDPIGITSVVIDKNKMRIGIKYSGGCKKHEFELLGHKMISKSIPPQRSIRLFHHADKDDCRELIEEIIVFDISAFAVGEGEVTLRLDGWETPLSYLPNL
ncbi:MAG: hypothetical protein GQ574_01975 [Crocinitomix sp.]|nr:hypothetical protein [Crocinitomix sp.]